MPDKWGRPEFSDWIGIMQAANTAGAIQDRTNKRADQKGIEVGMSSISDQQEEGTALDNMEKPGYVSERQWAAALADKHNLANMDEQRKTAVYNRWNQDFERNKAEASKALALLKGQKETNVTENQRKEALLDFTNKHVYDNKHYVGTEKNQAGAVVHVYEDSITGKRIEQPDVTADEMLWAADDYINRWFDKTAPNARSKRIEKNRQGLLNPVEMVNDSGENIYLYPQVKRGTDGYESVMVRKNPGKEVDQQDPMDFVETTVEEWVAKGYKTKPTLAVQGKQVDIAGKKAGQIQKSMDFIAKQLGVVQSKKKSSEDDILAMALGEDQGGAEMPAMSTLKGVFSKMEGGSPSEKALATSWLQMAGELYPGLKNMPDSDQGPVAVDVPGAGGQQVPTTDDDFLLNEVDDADVVKAARARNEKKKKVVKEPSNVTQELRDFESSPEYRKSPLSNMLTSTQQTDEEKKQRILAGKKRVSARKERDRRSFGARQPATPQNTAINMSSGSGIMAPYENLPVPFQNNPDDEALNMLRSNRPRR